MKAQQKVLVIGVLIFIFAMTLVMCSHSENMKKLDVQIEEIKIGAPLPNKDLKPVDPYAEVETARKKWLW